MEEVKVISRSYAAAGAADLYQYLPATRQWQLPITIPPCVVFQVGSTMQHLPVIPRRILICGA
ncbi:MAG: hypothetical protein ACLTDC_02720 [Lachnospiraceae bacterium]